MLVAGKHAILSPSSYHWVNYDDDKLDRVFFDKEAARRGTEQHEFARHAITLGQKLLDVQKTLNMYVNDAIGFRMTPEALLYYSDNCFGTADACCFKDETLRIHDLKTGLNEASFIQLDIYVALFCLDIGIHPADIQIETRIYQNDQIRAMNPDSADILHLMEKIKHMDRRLKWLKEVNE